MAFSLDRVVPWGRSFAEYRHMFALTEQQLTRRILGCADGPASFNAEATQLGAEVTSVDPLYIFSEWEIRSRIQSTYPEMIRKARQNSGEFRWAEILSVEELGRLRMTAMEGFLADYGIGPIFQSKDPQKGQNAQKCRMKFAHDSRCVTM